MTWSIILCNADPVDCDTGMKLGDETSADQKRILVDYSIFRSILRDRREKVLINQAVVKVKLN